MNLLLYYLLYTHSKFTFFCHSSSVITSYLLPNIIIHASLWDLLLLLLLSYKIYHLTFFLGRGGYFYHKKNITLISTSFILTLSYVLCFPQNNRHSVEHILNTWIPISLYSSPLKFISGLPLFTPCSFSPKLYSIYSVLLQLILNPLPLRSSFYSLSLPFTFSGLYPTSTNLSKNSEIFALLYLTLYITILNTICFSFIN